MLGIRLDEQRERGLEAIARHSRRPKSQIAREAIRSHVLKHNVLPRAKADWGAICEAERADPSRLSMFDGLATDITRDQ